MTQNQPWALKNPNSEDMRFRERKAGVHKVQAVARASGVQCGHVPRNVLGHKQPKTNENEIRANQVYMRFRDLQAHRELDESSWDPCRPRHCVGPWAIALALKQAPKQI